MLSPIQSQPSIQVGQPAPATRRSWGWWLVRLALFALALYVIWVALIVALQDVIIFPGRYFLSSEGTRQADVERVTLGNGPAAVFAWYEAGAGRSADLPGPAVLYVHGNLETISERWAQLEPWRSAGISVLAMEYRGYPGGGGGAPSEASLVADARVCYDWLASRPEVDPRRIIFQGQSLGGGVVIQLSRDRRPAAVVLTCTAFSVEARAAELGIPAFLCRNHFRNDLAIAALDAPILIFHGRHDTTMPVSHGRRLAAAARRARLIETEADHRALRPDWTEVWGFLRENGVVDADSK
ncbi:MAG: alpha/beta hydrolase [Phycisphaerae bacterium]